MDRSNLFSSFVEQAMKDSIHTTLKKVFGFDAFREGQEKVIRTILEGKSALAVFPTGSGKSLCYQLSALHLEGVTIVVSPLIALMKDQIDFLRARGIAAARLDSSLDTGAFQKINRELHSGKLRLLYVAPERFSNERFIQGLNRVKIALLVIDEAHCISEWGHNFRPDYLRLARLSRDLRIDRTLGLTATATPGVADDICREFAISPEAYVHTGFYRPNLNLQITECSSEERIKFLSERLQERPRGATIVYVTLQKTAEKVAAALVKEGFPTRAYHAGLEADERTSAQDWFMSSKDAIVVATIAFGMGIDKSDIRYVYHYNLPKSLENYSQEIGRAGRDGLAATCEILACGDDTIVLENFTYGDTPDDSSVIAIVDEIIKNRGEFELSAYQLSGAYDIRPLVLTTLLTYLELSDVIESVGTFYTEYQFAPKRSSAEILSRFDGERATFLRNLFALATKGKRWFSIDLDQAIAQLQTTRGRIIAALTYLDEQGELDLKVAGVRQGYRIRQVPKDLEKLKESLIERFRAREANDVRRVHQVVDLAEEKGCIVRRLLSHFGEKLGRDCGHCGQCADPMREPGRLGAKLATPTFKMDLIDLVRRSEKKALASPRQVARFLCGLTSPLSTQRKLSKHPLFGQYAEYSFREVMKKIAGDGLPEVQVVKS
jgi:ATP-dependent DNA helicase RecQ